MVKRIPLLVLTAQAMSALFKKACRCRPESKETSSWEAQTVTSRPIALELTHEVRDLLEVHCQGSYQASTGAGRVLQVDNLSCLEPAASICISLWIKPSHILPSNKLSLLENRTSSDKISRQASQLITSNLKQLLSSNNASTHLRESSKLSTRSSFIRSFQSS